MTAPFLLLTLEEHRDKVWVTKLLENLRVAVSVVSIEALLHGMNPSLLLQECPGIINRVSDAAETSSLVLGLLRSASLLDIPVFNGPESYGIAIHKWCHHVLFRQAGLHSPKSILQIKDDPPARSMLARPFLVKPNAGGFGKGIVLLRDEVDQDDTKLPAAPRLVQEYKNNSQFVYRVWFLCGKVQCAVQRPNTQWNGCVVSVEACPYVVPDSVRAEIERLLQLVPDAHAGSIEFLQDDEDSPRYYIDFNLLSTLPLDGDETWRQLARAVEVVLQVF